MIVTFTITTATVVIGSLVVGGKGNAGRTQSRNATI